MFRRIISWPVYSPLRRHTLRHFTEKATQKSGKIGWEDVPSDPRPPWVYSTSAGLRLILIPSILFYAVFFADFGEREHVFMPPRRWLQRQREAFFYYYTRGTEARRGIHASVDTRRDIKERLYIAFGALTGAAELSFSSSLSHIPQYRI